jgi:hypothetical protein
LRWDTHQSCTDLSVEETDRWKRADKGDQAWGAGRDQSIQQNAENVEERMNRFYGRYRLRR